MFSRVGRRLAILNTVVVVAIIFLVGAVTFFTLRRSLIHEVDESLRDRIAAVQETSAVGEIVENGNDNDEEDDDDDEDHQIVASGDTVLLVVDEAGLIISNPRGINLQGLPVSSGVDAALAGQTDTTTLTLNDGEVVRVMTAPLIHDGNISGAVQAIRSLEEHNDQLEIVRRMTLLGIGLGLIVAAPAGYYLSRRSMVPINQAFERQRAFAADASHELRTPLTLIRAYADVGLTEPGAADPEINALLTNILREVDLTDQHVDDLLLLARLDAGELLFDREFYRVDRLTNQVVDSMQPAAEQKDIVLNFDSSTDAIAYLDSARIQQAIRIVLNNALQYTDSGGQVDIRVSANLANGFILIEDNGSGIPQEDLPHIFDRYYRVDKSRSRVSGGTGLGLSIAQQIIHAHDGEISITSTVGVGTTVTIRIPITNTIADS